MSRGRALLVLGSTLVALATAWAAVAQIQANPVVTSLTLFAGTAEGLWRSQDWGSSWEPVKQKGSQGDDPRAIGAVHCILPIGPRVYAGGDGGLLISEDFGETWHRATLAGSVLSIRPSRFPQADPTVFVGTAAGLFKSVDGGGAFELLALRGVPVHRIEWPGPELVVATGAGVFSSPDAGKRFAGPGGGLPAKEVRALTLSSFYSVDPVVFAGGWFGVFRSSDGGRIWELSGLPDSRVADLVWLGPFLYAVTEGGLFRSEDAGRSWSPLGEGLGTRVPARLLFPLAPDSGAEALLATDDGVLKTADGGYHWQPIGLAGKSVRCVATFPPPERAGRKRGR